MEKRVEKNYNCEICEKRFSSKQNKNQHANRVHGDEKQFICNVCNKIFVSLKDLTAHVKSSHQNDWLFEYDPNSTQIKLHFACKSCFFCLLLSTAMFDMSFVV